MCFAAFDQNIVVYLDRTLELKVKGFCKLSNCTIYEIFFVIVSKQCYVQTQSGDC